MVRTELREPLKPPLSSSRTERTAPRPGAPRHGPGAPARSDR
jgi:hypothetical protein